MSGKRPDARTYNARPWTADEKNQNGALAEYFGLAPFSVLSARSGWWQQRKRAWISLGIKSEVGRGENLLNFSDSVRLDGKAYRENFQKNRSKINKSSAHRDQDKLNALRARRADATPGGSVRGKNSVSKSKTEDGYVVGEDAQAAGTGTSIFDPVICEIAYRWFCPQGGQVLDPFAGGSVRGVVASALGRRYTGVDLREEQVRANEAQAETICDEPAPEWVVGDSRDLDKLVGKLRADFVFSCPPYADLEVYSDDERDLSTLDYDEFRETYAAIIKASCAKLRDNRFACFVVGDVRDKRGAYRSFPAHTIEAFEDAGLTLHNEMILVTAAGSLPLRVGRPFKATRKVGKTHQQIYVFCKGDPRKATEAVGDVDFGVISTLDPGQQVVPLGDQGTFF